MASRKGQFEKGHKLAKGRPKGAENKEKKKLRNFLTQVLEDNQEKFNKELLSLNSKDFVYAFINLLEYSTPKLNRTDITTDGEKITQEFYILPNGKELPW